MSGGWSGRPLALLAEIARAGAPFRVAM